MLTHLLHHFLCSMHRTFLIALIEAWVSLERGVAKWVNCIVIVKLCTLFHRTGWVRTKVLAWKEWQFWVSPKDLSVLIPKDNADAERILLNSWVQSAWPHCSWPVVEDPGYSLSITYFCSHSYDRITRSKSRRYSNLRSTPYNTPNILKEIYIYTYILKKYPWDFLLKIV